MLGVVVALRFQGPQVLVRNVAGHVAAVEDGRLEVRERGLHLGDRVLQVLQVLEDDLVRATGLTINT